MSKKYLSLLVLIVMALNIFSAPAFASSCPGMSSDSDISATMMGMPCHDDLVDCMEDCGCSSMLSGTFFILADLNILKTPILKQQHIAAQRGNLVSQNILPLKRPPRILS